MATVLNILACVQLFRSVISRPKTVVFSKKDMALTALIWLATVTCSVIQLYIMKLSEIDQIVHAYQVLAAKNGNMKIETKFLPIFHCRATENGTENEYCESTNINTMGRPEAVM